MRLAATDCNAKRITISWDLAESRPSLGSWTASKLQAIASHEVSHALGLGHSGRYDNVQAPGTYPRTSSTCLTSPGFLTGTRFNVDDRAALLHTFENYQLADPSFEDAALQPAWGAVAGSLTRVLGATPSDGGSRFGRFLPSDITSNYAFQRQSMYNWSPGGGWTTFRVSARKAVPQASDNISVQIWSRRYDYETSSNCLAFPTDLAAIPGLNAHVRQYPYSEGLQYQIRNHSIRPASSTWDNSHAVSVYLQTGDHGAIDFQVRVTSDVKYNNSPSPIDLDLARFVS